MTSYKYTIDLTPTQLATGVFVDVASITEVHGAIPGAQGPAGANGSNGAPGAAGPGGATLPVAGSQYVQLCPPGAGNYTLSAGFEQYLPFVAAGACTIDRIVYQVNVLGAGSTVTVKVYADNGGKPGTLIASATDNSGAGSTGVTREVVISAAVNGACWIGIVSSGGVNPQVLNGAEPFPRLARGSAQVLTSTAIVSYFLSGGNPSPFTVGPALGLRATR